MNRITLCLFLPTILSCAPASLKVIFTPKVPIQRVHSTTEFSQLLGQCPNSAEAVALATLFDSQPTRWDSFVRLMSDARSALRVLERIIHSGCGPHQLDLVRTVVGSSRFRSEDAPQMRRLLENGPLTDAGVVKTLRTFSNTPPQISSITVSGEGRAGTTLSCQVIATDEDGETPAMTITWFTTDSEGRVAILSESTPLLTVRPQWKGRVIRCTAEATDGYSSSESAASKDILYTNSLPVFRSPPTISPQTARRGDALTCTPAAADDADGESVTTAVQWYRNGQPVADATNSVWNGGAARKGDVITCGATAHDGNAPSTELPSAGVTILNSPPAGTVSCPLTQGFAAVVTGTHYAWSCAGATDADDDPLVYQPVLAPPGNGCATMTSAGSLEGTAQSGECPFTVKACEQTAPENCTTESETYRIFGYSIVPTIPALPILGAKVAEGCPITLTATITKTPDADITPTTCAGTFGLLTTSASPVASCTSLSAHILAESAPPGPFTATFSATGATIQGRNVEVTTTPATRNALLTKIPASSLTRPPVLTGLESPTWGDARRGEGVEARPLNTSSPTQSCSSSSDCNMPNTPIGTLTLSSDGHGCAADGGGGFVCWGDNTSGESGQGAGAAVANPTRVAHLSAATAYRQAAASDDHSCVLWNEGRIQCWGANDKGQLGIGNSDAQPQPVAVCDGACTGSNAITSAQSIASGPRGFTCLTESDGEVKCWGDNAFGQLGAGDAQHRSAPTPIASLAGNVIAVSAGGTATRAHTCALLKNGTVNCWGSNNAGQLGDNSTADRNLPVVVAGITNAVAVGTGGEHSCALLSSGNVVCWGLGSSGQLGHMLSTNSLTPVSVKIQGGADLDDVVALALGELHSCVLRGDRTTWCWGENSQHELGLPDSTTNRNFAAAIPGLGPASALALARDTCALLADGTLSCWGQHYGSRPTTLPTSTPGTPFLAKIRQCFGVSLTSAP